MTRVTKLGWAAYTIALATIVIDQLSKAWVLTVLHGAGDSIPVLPFLNFTLVHNSGVSFHLFAGGDLSRWGLSIFSIVVAVGIAVWARKADKPLNAAALGLIMGGAVGNAIDRIRLGVVTDFLDASALHFPWVFNGADSAISVGVALLLLEGVLAPKAP